jgi:hypothetical protein
MGLAAYDGGVIYVYVVIILLIVVGVPCFLMGLLLYHGLKLDWQDLTKHKQVKRERRGFEVLHKTDKPRDPDQ